MYINMLAVGHDRRRDRFVFVVFLFFFFGSVILCFVVAWVDVARLDLNIKLFIHIQFKADNQSHLAPGGIHQGRKSVCIRLIRGIRVLSFFDGIGSFVHGGCVGSCGGAGTVKYSIALLALSQIPNSPA
jgi:hypothetical protein